MRLYVYFKFFRVLIKLYKSIPKYVMKRPLKTTVCLAEVTDNHRGIRIELGMFFNTLLYFYLDLKENIYIFSIKILFIYF